MPMDDMEFYKKYNLPKYYALLEEQENGKKAEEKKQEEEEEVDIYDSETFKRQFDKDNEDFYREPDHLAEYAVICKIVSSVM